MVVPQELQFVAIWQVRVVAEPLKVTGQLAEHLAYKGDYVYRQIRDENAKWLTANDT